MPKIVTIRNKKIINQNGHNFGCDLYSSFNTPLRVALYVYLIIQRDNKFPRLPFLALFRGEDNSERTNEPTDTPRIEFNWEQKEYTPFFFFRMHFLCSFCSNLWNERSWRVVALSIHPNVNILFVKSILGN